MLHTICDLYNTYCYNTYGSYPQITDVDQPKKECKRTYTYSYYYNGRNEYEQVKPEYIPLDSEDRDRYFTREYKL